jgi:hypothetical protein
VYQISGVRSSLIPWNKVVLEISILAHMIKNSQPFMGLRCFLTYSQEPATGPSLEPDEPISHVNTVPNIIIFICMCVSVFSCINCLYAQALIIFVKDAS